MLRDLTEASEANRFDRFAMPMALAAIAFIALQTSFANLPSNKIFVGHDTGFYNIVPRELLRQSLEAWETKADFGYANFRGLFPLPYTLFVGLLGALRFDGPSIGRILYFVELITGAYGSFALAWLALRRCFPSLRPAASVIAAAAASMFGTYNVWTATLMLYPPSTFQFGTLIWPGVIAAALAVIWYRPTIGAGILLGILCAITTCGNAAHALLGFALLAAIYVVNGISSKRRLVRPAVAAAVTLVAVTAYAWLPTLVTLVLYKGGVVAAVQTDAASLVRAEDLVLARTTVTNLLRFDGLTWWPLTPNGDLYASLPMMILTGVPALVAFFSLRSRAPLSRWLWVVVLLGVFLSKGRRLPIPIDTLWLETNVPVLAAYRSQYDKFVMLLMIAFPPLFAIGTVLLATSKSAAQRFLAAAGVACAVAGAWPFLAGRIADPYFLTTLPRDYGEVDRLLGENSRTLSLPGAVGEIYIASWFKGSNFENMIFRSRLVNGAIFKTRPISSAPLFDDTAAVQAQDLPRLVGAAGLFGFDHVLLHKDYLTSYHMAWDYERYNVLGPLVSLEFESVLDHDVRVRKVYEGSDLVLYAIDPKATMDIAYATERATLAVAYEDALLPFSDAGLTAPARDPLLLFLGNQSIPQNPAGAAVVTSTLGRATEMAVAPAVPETDSLYREQITVPRKRFAEFGPQYVKALPASAYVFAQPHGDYLTGVPPPAQNLTGSFTAASAKTMTPAVVLGTRRVPTAAFARWFGSDAGTRWTISAYADETVPYVELNDGTGPPARGDFVTPVSSMGLGPGGAVFTMQQRSGPKANELAVAGQPLPRPLPLIADPHLTLSYDSVDPSRIAAWLRIVLVRDDGRMMYYDRKLDAGGLIEDMPLRDAAQSALDKRFDDELALHQNDPQWVASQSFFNPEQADAYRIVGLRLVYGKPPGADMHLTPVTCAVQLRSLRISLFGAPWRSYLRRGATVSFTGGKVSTNLSTATVTARSGALLVNAVVPERTENVREPLAGRAVVLRMLDGTIVRGDVLREDRDGYLVQLDGNQRQFIARSGVFAILGTADQRFRRYGVTVPLPPIDVSRYPEVRVRYWLGSDGIRPALAFAVQTPSGRREIRATADNADAPDPRIPWAWITATDFPGLALPIALDGEPTAAGGDSGWREATFDLRDLAARQLGTIRVVPTDVTLTMAMDAGPEGSISSYAFGFGDVIFAGEQSGTAPAPDDAALILDGKRMMPASIDVSAEPDLVTVRYPQTRLRAGAHAVSTAVHTPWEIKSAEFVAPASAPSRAHLDVRPIADELYGLHVDATGPAWIAFAQTFHSGWQLYEGKAPADRWSWLFSLRWLGKSDPDHVVANSYGNAWYARGAGPRDYVIDFAPQDFATLAQLFSAFALVLALAVAGYAWRRV